MTVRQPLKRFRTLRVVAVAATVFAWTSVHALALIHAAAAVHVVCAEHAGLHHADHVDAPAHGQRLDNPDRAAEHADDCPLNSCLQPRAATLRAPEVAVEAARVASFAPVVETRTTIASRQVRLPAKQAPPLV